MGLNDFTMKKTERALPVFILADTSGSMSENGKIEMLNNALREMVSSLRNVDDIRGIFQVGIITFGESVAVHQELCDVKDIQLKELSASGRTPMGQAMKLITSIISSKDTIPSTAYTPTIVLVSDGYPTDIEKKGCNF